MMKSIYDNKYTKDEERQVLMSQSTQCQKFNSNFNKAQGVRPCGRVRVSTFAIYFTSDSAFGAWKDVWRGRDDKRVPPPEYSYCHIVRGTGAEDKKRGRSIAG